MKPVPTLTVRELVSLIVLYRIDTEWSELGNHTRWTHRDGRTTTVPERGDRPISPTLVRLVAADLEMAVDDFVGGL